MAAVTSATRTNKSSRIESISIVDVKTNNLLLTSAITDAHQAHRKAYLHGDHSFGVFVKKGHRISGRKIANGLSKAAYNEEFIDLNAKNAGFTS